MTTFGSSERLTVGAFATDTVPRKLFALSGLEYERNGAVAVNSGRGIEANRMCYCVAVGEHDRVPNLNRDRCRVVAGVCDVHRLRRCRRRSRQLGGSACRCERAHREEQQEKLAHISDPLLGAYTRGSAVGVRIVLCSVKFL